MTWSDAIRAEAEALDDEAVPRPAEEFDRFGTLGRALWRERSLAWMLRLAAVGSDDAQRIVSDLRAAFLPVHRERPNFAARPSD